MGEATTERSAAEFTEAAERLGASISINPGRYRTSATLSTLTKNLDAAMDLLEERILKPAFTEADFKLVKDQTMESLQQAKKDASGAGLTRHSRSHLWSNASAVLPDRRTDRHGGDHYAG